MSSFEVKFNETDLRNQIRREISKQIKQEICNVSDRHIHEMIREVVDSRTNEIIEKIVTRTSKMLWGEAYLALINKENEQKHE